MIWFYIALLVVGFIVGLIVAAIPLATRINKLEGRLAGKEMADILSEPKGKILPTEMRSVGVEAREGGQKEMPDDRVICRKCKKHIWRMFATRVRKGYYLCSRCAK